MLFFFLVAALLLATSGGLKLRSTTRLGMGLAPLALLELVAAVGLMLVGFPGGAVGGVLARWSIPAGMLLLVVSSADHARRVRSVRARREETEGGRLAAYVKYLSRDIESDDGGL